MDANKLVSAAPLAMPEEPNFVNALRVTGIGVSWCHDILGYIDSLRSRLEAALEQIEIGKTFEQAQLDDANRWRERAEQAERKLAKTQPIADAARRYIEIYAGWLACDDTGSALNAAFNDLHQAVTGSTAIDAARSEGKEGEGK